MRRKKQDEQNEHGHNRDGESIDKPDPKYLEADFFAKILRKAPKEGAGNAPADPPNPKAPFQGWKIKMIHTSRDQDPKIDETESFPGLTRDLLTAQQNAYTFGSYLCKSLTEDLEEHYDDLLFGLIDDIYLHCVTSFSISGKIANIGIKIFWAPEESHFRLVIPNASDIIENPELVYLIIGDLVEDLVNWFEKPPRRKRSGGKKRKR